MIRREPYSAAQHSYDVIVVGGGIYGACTLWETVRRGLRGLLIERQDFGGATSWNSLRILHGGLRYLQTLDLTRFRESVRERRWFCQHFPDAVQPLPCLMPLYGRGLKRPATMRVALALNDWLSRDRNRGTLPALQLPDSRLLDADATIRLFPQVDRHGLQGAALWYDAQMLSPQRILIGLLHEACGQGATALNYVEATGLLQHAGRVVGLSARDGRNGAVYEYRSNWVINCAGRWSRELTAALDRDVPRLFQPSLAFNVLLDREPLSSAALAVQAQGPDQPVYFLVPWGGKILAGTRHQPWTGSVENPQPSSEQVRQFLDGLNLAVPNLDLEPSQVVRVYAGLLPTKKPGSHELTKRPVVYNHARHGGPRGLISLSGIKFTTARLVAEQALQAIPLGRPPRENAEAYLPHRPAYGLDLLCPQDLFEGDDHLARASLRRLVREEAVFEWDDLLLRRTDWGSDPALENRIRQRVGDLLCARASIPLQSTAICGRGAES